MLALALPAQRFVLPEAYGAGIVPCSMAEWLARLTAELRGFPQPAFEAVFVLWRLLVIVQLLAVPAQGIVVPHTHAPAEGVASEGASHECQPHFHLGGASGHSYHVSKHHHHRGPSGSSRARTTARVDHAHACHPGEERASRAALCGERTGVGNELDDARDDSERDEPCPCGEGTFHVGEPLASPASDDGRLDPPRTGLTVPDACELVVSPVSRTCSESFLRPPDDGPPVALFLRKCALRL